MIAYFYGGYYDCRGTKQIKFFPEIDRNWFLGYSG